MSLIQTYLKYHYLTLYLVKLAFFVSHELTLTLLSIRKQNALVTFVHFSLIPLFLYSRAGGYCTRQVRGTYLFHVDVDVRGSPCPEV